MVLGSLSYWFMLIVWILLAYGDVLFFLEMKNPIFVYMKFTPCNWKKNVGVTSMRSQVEYPKDKKH